MTEDLLSERELGLRWGWLLALGAALVVIGLFSLSSVVVVTLATVVVLGGFILAGAVTQFVLALSTRSWRGFTLHLLMAILGGVVGVMLITRPGLGAGVLTLFVASWLLVSGIGQIVHALADNYAHRVGAIIAGAASGLLGILLLGRLPETSLWFLGFCIGIHLVVQGIAWMALSFAIHRAARSG